MLVKNKILLFFGGLSAVLILAGVLGFSFFSIKESQAEDLGGGTYGGACICEEGVECNNIIHNYCLSGYTPLCSGAFDYCTCECLNTSQTCSPVSECCLATPNGNYSSPLGSPCSESYEETCNSSNCGSGRASEISYKNCGFNDICTGVWQTHNQILPACDMDELCSVVSNEAVCTYYGDCPPACYPTGTYKLSIRNASGNEVAFIDSDGYLAVNGLFQNRGGPSFNLPTTGAFFVINDSSNNLLAYFNSSGFLYLKGSLYAEQPSLTPVGSGNFIIQNPDGDTVAYFDSPAGNLYILKCQAGSSLDYDGDGFTISQGDCYDNNASVKPSQTGYFYEPYVDNLGNIKWDYNCNGAIEKSLRDFYNPDIIFSYTDNCDWIVPEDCASNDLIFYTSDLTNEVCGNAIMYHACAWLDGECQEHQNVGSAQVVCH